MESYVVKYDEISLKSPTVRKRLENALIENLKKYGTVKKRDGRLIFSGNVEKARKVFGVLSLAKVKEVEKNLEQIIEALEEIIKEGKKVRVKVKRIDKSFPLTSLEIWEKIVEVFPEVAGKEGELIEVEIRNNSCLILHSHIEGPGGVPYDTQGEGVTLFSGGIDSPVASWFMAKRGISQYYLYVSNCACIHEDVVDVAKFMKEEWNIPKAMLVVDGSEGINEIMKVKNRYRMVLFKRFLYRLGEKVAKELGVKALITGESLGQVSTQTLGNLYVIEAPTDILVLRPLIGLDKREIVNKAKEIGSYELSIRVKERCALSRGKVAINPKKEVIDKIEEEIKITDIAERALEEMRFIEL